MLFGYGSCHRSYQKLFLKRLAKRICSSIILSLTKAGGSHPALHGIWQQHHGWTLWRRSFHEAISCPVPSPGESQHSWAKKAGRECSRTRWFCSGVQTWCASYLTSYAVPTYDGPSNFTNSLVGHRLYYGFWTVIQLDRKALALIFVDREEGQAADFEERVRRVMDRTKFGEPSPTSEFDLRHSTQTHGLNASAKRRLEILCGQVSVRPTTS